MATQSLTYPSSIWTPPAHADEDPAELLAGANVKARIALAHDLEDEKMDDVVRALAAMAERKLKKGTEYPDDLDFLAEYTVAQPTRALRMLAIGAGQHLGAKGYAQRLCALADGEARGPTARAAEALGYVGDEAVLEKLLQLAASPSQSIAVFACEALAKVGKKKGTPDALLEIALHHENAEIADHATWAAQDLMKNQKALIKRLKKLAGKDESLAVRVSSLEAMLLDGALPLTWRDDVVATAREAILAAPAEVTIEANDSKYRAKMEESLAWLETNMPGALLVVRTSVARIEVPGKLDPKSHVDLENNAVCVPFSYAGGQSPKQLAYHILRVASVLFEKRVGNPYTGHRGWDSAIFDTYDLCRIAQLYDAGKGGINRDQFLQVIVETRPWGGN